MRYTWGRGEARALTTKVHFRERQHFRQAMGWAVLIPASAVLMGTVVWMLVRQLVQGKPFAPEAMPDGMLVMLGASVLLINAGYLLRFALSTLDTEVSDAGLFLRYWPRQRKVRQLSLAGASSVETVRYRAFLAYGGRGLRRRRDATAYTIRGEDGVRIDFENGVHVLIGSQRPEALRDAIEQVRLRETDAS